jgi:hypothetical protein
VKVRSHSTGLQYHFPKKVLFVFSTPYFFSASYISSDGSNLLSLTSSFSDHVNDYCMLEKNANSQPALWMCYAGGAGFGGYGGYGGYIRRVRFFDIDMNTASIVTYKRLEAGPTTSRIDEMTVVNGGKVFVEP